MKRLVALGGRSKAGLQLADLRIAAQDVCAKMLFGQGGEIANQRAAQKPSPTQFSTATP